MRTVFISLSLAALFLLVSCSGQKSEAKNLEQIYAEEGVPVKVQIIKPQSFKNRFTTMR